jgi:DASH complex subunit ASK1
MKTPGMYHPPLVCVQHHANLKYTAKEASKRIVEDLLFTAGVNDTTDDIIDEQSPSVIRRVERLEDETF